jgi:hypothetical protein
VYPFEEGLAEIRVEKVSFSWGVVLGNVIQAAGIPYLPDEDRNLAQNNIKRGFIDTAGTQVIPTKYDVVGTFNNGLALVVNKGLAGFVNRKGEL